MRYPDMKALQRATAGSDVVIPIDAAQEGRRATKERLQVVLSSALEAAFLVRYKQLGGLGEWVRNHRFLPDSKMELDFAMPAIRCGIEVNGGQWQKSGHSSGKGLHRDADKQNRAILAGWTIFWLTTDMLSKRADPVHVQRIVEYVNERIL